MFGMKWSLKDLAGKAVILPGVITGVHCILKPDASRVIALLVNADTKQFLLYISQVDEAHFSIEVEAGETARETPAGTGPRAVKTHSKAYNRR